jgi:glycosyltransferase involved in cell wall biosynthesis
MKSRKIALVHDWFTVYSGSERVCEQIIHLYPEVDVFSLLDFLPEDQRKFLGGKKPSTSFVQNLPFARNKYRQYIGLMPIAVEQLDLSHYDLVLSSSHAVAKGVITGPDQLHISYIHSPLRYAWDMQQQYLREARLERGIKSAFARLLLHYLRLWDLRTANGVDVFLANSQFIARRIFKVYRREARVVYPPVDVDYFSLSSQRENEYLAVSRFVQYKKMDLIIDAFTAMPEKRLHVIGDGPDFKRLQASAGPNITLMGYQSSQVIKERMQKARALIFAAMEDFGIVPVEAQACGTPVIAYGQGGVLETVRNIDQSNPTGIFFTEQSIDSVQNAVHEFEKAYQAFSPQACRDNALRFSIDRFRDDYSIQVEHAWEQFNKVLVHKEN